MRAGSVWMPAMSEVSARHFWRPSGDVVRHAFRGRRWCGQTEATAVCGSTVSLATEVAELDWVRAPTCEACNAVLRSELPKITGFFG